MKTEEIARRAAAQSSDREIPEALWQIAYQLAVRNEAAAGAELHGRATMRADIQAAVINLAETVPGGARPYMALVLETIGKIPV